MVGEDLLWLGEEKMKNLDNPTTRQQEGKANKQWVKIAIACDYTKRKTRSIREKVGKKGSTYVLKKKKKKKEEKKRKEERSKNLGKEQKDDKAHIEA
jgi:hypothetical protein